MMVIHNGMLLAAIALVTLAMAMRLKPSKNKDTGLPAKPLDRPQQPQPIDHLATTSLGKDASGTVVQTPLGDQLLHGDQLPGKVSELLQRSRMDEPMDALAAAGADVQAAKAKLSQAEQVLVIAKRVYNARVDQRLALRGQWSDAQLAAGEDMVPFTERLLAAEKAVREADVEVAKAELVEAENALVGILADGKSVRRWLKQRQEAKGQTSDDQLAEVNNKLLAADEAVKEAKETWEGKVRAMKEAETQEVEEAVLDETMDTLAALKADVRKEKAEMVKAQEAVAAAKVADKKARKQEKALLSERETSNDSLAAERHQAQWFEAVWFAEVLRVAEVAAEEASKKWNGKVQSLTKAAYAKTQPQKVD